MTNEPQDYQFIESFKNVVAQVSLAIVVAQDQTIVYANEGFCAYYQYLPEQLVGKKITLVLDAFSSTSFFQKLSLDFSLHQSKTCAIISNTGIVNQAEVHIYLFDNEQDTQKHYLMVFQPIPENRASLLDKFSTILSQISNSFLILDPLNGKILEASKGLIHLLGYEKEALLKKYIHEISHTYHSEKNNWEELLKANFESHQTTQFNGNLIRANDKPYPVAITLSKIVLENEPFTLLDFQDTTSLTYQNSKLQESKKRFKLLTEATFESITILENGYCVEANQATTSLLGYTHEELIGMHAIEVIAPKYRALVAKNIHEKYELPYEVEALRKDGTRFFAEIQGKMVTIDGKEIRVTSLRDISYRKKSEETLQQYQVNLRAIIENTDYSIWSIDKNYKLLFFNQNFDKDYQRFFGKQINIGDVVFDFEDNRYLFWKTQYDLVLSGKRIIKQLSINDEHYEVSFNPIIQKDEIVGVVGYVQDITQEKQIERELKESNRVLEEAQDFAKMGLWSFDLKNQTIHWSKNTFLSFGLDEKTAKIPSFEQYQHLIHPEDWQVLSQHIEQCIQEGKNYEIELRHLQPDDSYKWFFVKAKAELDSSKNVIGVSGVVLDIDEVKKLELKKQEVDKKLSALFGSKLWGVGIAGPNKEILQFNQAYADLLGYTPEELTQLTWLDFTHPEDIPQDQIFLAKLQNGEIDEYTTEKRYIRKDKKIIDVEVSIQSIRQENGKIDFLISLVKDITDKKQAQKRIQESELKFSKIFYASPLYLVISKMQDGKFIDVNHSTAESFGYTRDEMIGKTSFELKMVRVQDRQKAIKLLQEKGYFKGLEATYYKKNGEEVIGLASGEIIIIDDEPCIIQSIIDITQRKKYEQTIQNALEQQQRLNEELSTREEELSASEEALRQINQELSQSNDELLKTNQELDRFVYSASHDLRAPIASILGLIELSKDNEDIVQIMDYLKLMEVSIKRLDNFIQDILDYSRNKRTDLEIEKIDFEQLVRQVIQQYSYLENADKMDIQIHVQANASFYSDPKRLQVVFNNLISNAIRYMNKYAEQPFLHIDLAITPSKASVLLHDNGIGIAAEHLPRIFEMFYRATNQKTGSGLGLYIVKETLQRLNATIQIDSKIGEGTQIRLQIPNLQPENTLPT